MDVGVRPYLPVVAPTRRKCLPEPGSKPLGLAPVQDAAAAVYTHGVGHRLLLLRLHIAQVLPVPVSDAAKILENHLALAGAWVGVDGEVDGSVGGLSDRRGLGKAAPSIVPSLGPGEVRHAGCIALFKTAHDPESCIAECGHFNPGQIPQVALHKADVPALILKAADALDN